MKRINYNLLFILFVNVCLLVLASCKEKKADTYGQFKMPAVSDSAKQKALLENILRLLPPESNITGHVSFLDETIQDWLNRTGELPPDFDRMPSIPFLPDPLVLDEGGENIPVKTMAQWKEKREWMKEQLEYYITGTCPPKPDNLVAKVINEKKEGETTLRI